MHKNRKNLFPGGDVINRETAFSDLAKDENLNKLNMEPAIKPIFASVLQKMQAYFDKKGLMNANNYAMLFEKHLLTDGPEKWRFEVGDLGTTDGLTNVMTKTITISQKRMAENHYLLEQIVCHEFIHFLVMASLPFVEQKDGTFVQDQSRYVMPHFKGGTFINEGYTQLLTNRIIPESNMYYTNLVKMVEFFNYVMKVDDNFFAFLRQQMPALTVDNSFVLGFITASDKYFTNNYKKNLSSRDIAEKDEDYMQAFKEALFAFYTQMIAEIDHLDFENVYEYMARIQNYLPLLPVENDDAFDMLRFVNQEFVKRYFPLATKNEKNEYVKKLFKAEIFGSYLVRQISEQFEFSSHNCNVALNIGKNEIELGLSSKTGEYNIAFSIDATKLKNQIMRIECAEPFKIGMNIKNNKLTFVFTDDKETNRFDYDVSHKRMDKFLKSYERKQNEILDDLQSKMDEKKAVQSRILKQDPTITHLVSVKTKGKVPTTFYVAKYLDKRYSLVVLDEQYVRRSELTYEPYFNISFANGTSQVINLKRYKAFDEANQPLESNIEYWAKKIYLSDVQRKMDVKATLITPTEKEF